MDIPKNSSKVLLIGMIWLACMGILFIFNGNLYAAAQSAQMNHSTFESVITHGPILGRLSHDSVGVWVRTSRPARFRVTCRIGHVCVAQSPVGEAHLENDNTGWVLIPGLKPNTTYDYEVEPDSNYWMKGGSFTTLPHADAVRNPQNPEGLFNFSFEFGCGNQQNLLEDPGERGISNPQPLDPQSSALFMLRSIQCTIIMSS